MLMELSRRRGVAARTSGQARPIGWSEPARLPAAAQRLIVLIEGIPMSCRDTTPHAPSAWPHVAHLRLPIKALALLEQYPYRSRPTLPTHKSSLYTPARDIDVTTKNGLRARCRSVCHTRDCSRSEHLFMLRAMRIAVLRLRRATSDQ